VEAHLPQVEKESYFLMDSYDSKEGIEAHLTDLDGLHRLRQARREAGYDRNEHMHEWIVLGRFYLDTCGNFMPTIFEHDDGECYLKLDWLAESLPRVISQKDLLAVLTKLSMTSTMSSFPPETHHRCRECERGWTLATCHDAVRCSDDSFAHAHCFALHREKQAFTTYYHAVTQSGLQGSRLDAIPNEYDPKGVPWARVRTLYGTFKMGRRKRVFELDWSEVVKDRCRGRKYEEREKIQRAFRAQNLFSKEDVTKEDALIHAWSEGKLVEYLTVLAGVMRKAEVE
jgi:hypothetical protein